MRTFNSISAFSFDLVLILGIVGIPLLAFLVAAIWKRKPIIPQFIAALSGISFAGALALFFRTWNTSAPGEVSIASWTWIDSAFTGFDLSLVVQLDNLSVLMALIVTGIAFLVNIFSLSYMNNDPNINRYFGLLSFFCASMLGIVFSGSLLTMFIFWELVGFSSYLLIGFWYKKNGPANASLKAFLINRLGDVGFLLGIFLLLSSTGTTVFADLFDLSNNLGPETQSAIVLLLFCGAMAKSAQFPFQTWLPDAMEGPTPVSSLIHAATMVAAGVFLLVRLSGIFLIPDIILWVGLVTALLAALSAINQYDIKRVLAYSTISQLGYMVAGVGAGASEMSMFHLSTHAFFKCGLFLSAGAIIHSLHHFQERKGIRFDAQDLRIMGGFKGKLPWLFWVQLVFTLSIIGIPGFSGFMSKDGIIMAIVNHSTQSGGIDYLAPILAFLTAGLTAFYMVRHFLLVFAGNSRFENSEEYWEPLDWKMTVPLGLLGLFSFWFFWNPTNPVASKGWLLTGLELQQEEHSHSLMMTLMAIGLPLAGGALAWFFYKDPERMLGRKENPVSRLFRKHFFLDEIYDLLFLKPLGWLQKGLDLVDEFIIDGLVNGLAKVTGGIDGEIPSLAKISKDNDERMVDGLVNRIGYSVIAMGRNFRMLQPGKVQLYLVFGLGALLLLLLYLIYFASA